MPTYYVELTKTISVPIEAATMEEAFEDAIYQSEEHGFDGAWDNTMPEPKCLGIAEEELPFVDGDEP